MKTQRRNFITLLGGAAAAAWPLAARAQQAGIPVVGYLSAGAVTADGDAAFQRGLGDTGFTNDRNVAIEYRSADNVLDRLPALATELAARKVAVIVTPGSLPATLAAKAATTTIPIVFWIGTDPVHMGVVTSFNRPSGNVTGIATMDVELSAKRLGLLHDLLPRATRFAVFTNVNNPATNYVVPELHSAAASIGASVEVFAVASEGDFEAAFGRLLQWRAEALLVTPEPLFGATLSQLTPLAARHGVPMIYGYRQFAEAGGLISYSASSIETYHQMGVYTGRILKGEKPSDLPVVRPTRFELIINRATALQLGIAIPSTLLAIADEVIE